MHKIDKRRQKVLFVRLNEREHKLCAKAAKAADLTMGEWARGLLVYKATP